MNNIFKTTGAFLCRTWVWTLLVILSIALLVWFAGPLLAVDGHKVWESPASRLLTISFLFLLWGLLVVFTGWRAGMRKKTLHDSADGQAMLRRREQMAEERKALKSRFRAALKTLRTSRRYRGRSERWRRDLPWYLLMGPEGSGKTCLLDFSGLEFPINTIERKRPRDAQGTDHCHWYFADQGVLIDTAGRYLTQTNIDIDGTAWKTLLRHLRQRRRERPLNGVLVTIAIDTLLGGSDQDLEHLARQVRARLQEVHQRLRVNVPIYLVLTKADHVPGFDEFFDLLTREESDQVLGASFRKDQDGTDIQILHGEFEALLNRLDSQVIMRMHQERDTRRRSRILDFPHQLAPVGERLCLFVDMAFSGNRYQPASQFRGFYLTGAAPLAQSASTDVGHNLAINALAMASGGRSRFIHHLFSRVIFPEADLAGLDRRERRRLHWGQRMMCAATLVVLVVCGALWAGGFAANHERLERLRHLTETDGLETLDGYYAATQVFPAPGNASYQERVGLYQGNRVNPVVEAAYRRELERTLLPRMAGLLEAQIRVNLDDRERLLDSLRAYLMLNSEARRDASWLRDWIADLWAQQFPGDTKTQKRLNAHVERLLQQPFSHSPDTQLVTQARQVLRSESVATVAYRRLREQARDLPDYRLSQHLGAHVSLFLSTDQVIPGLYTRSGYQRFFSLQGAQLVKDFLQDDWVLGDASGISPVELQRLMVELEQLYFRDYADYWSEAVDAVTLRVSNSFPEAAEQLAGMTSAHSPVLRLLVQVRENTRFVPSSGNARNAAPPAVAPDNAAEKMLVAAAVVSNAVAARNDTSVQKDALHRQFAPLHRLLDEHGGPTADLAQALTTLNGLHMQIAGLARADSAEFAAFEMARRRMDGRQDTLSSVRTAASHLPRPVSAWFDGLADDAWGLTLEHAYDYVNQRYQSELYPFYGKAIRQRYPFNAHSTSDVALKDFRQFFMAQGIADRFFNHYLQPFVSGDAGTYRLRSVDGRTLPVSRAYLEQMANASLIRRSFFSDHPTEPQVQFELEPYTLDPAISRAYFSYGDATLEYRHGPIVPVSLKWPTDAQNGRTSLVLESMAGPTLGIEKNTGPWSLFRLLDLMSADYLSGRDVRVLKAEVGGLRAHYLLTSQRAPNPFDMTALRAFRMPAQL